jgi:hypothetical protein
VPVNYTIRSSGSPDFLTVRRVVHDVGARLICYPYALPGISPRSSPAAFPMTLFLSCFLLTFLQGPCRAQASPISTTPCPHKQIRRGRREKCLSEAARFYMLDASAALSRRSSNTAEISESPLARTLRNLSQASSSSVVQICLETPIGSHIVLGQKAQRELPGAWQMKHIRCPQGW